MPININVFHADIRNTLRKYNSAFVSPEAIDQAANKACVDILEQVIKEYESSPRRFMADQELLIDYAFTGVATIRTLPTDVFKVSSVADGDYEGDLLSDNEFRARIKSVILKPTSKRPVATVYNDGSDPKIRIEPSSSTHRITYWKVPTTCVFGYTQASGVITYAAGSSTDIDFPQSEYTRLFNRSLTYLTPAAQDPNAGQLETMLK